MSDDHGMVDKEISGVPMWVWGGGIATLFLLYAYLHRKSSAPSVAVSDPGFTPLDSSLNDFTSSGSAGNNATSQPSTTNASWVANAEATLAQMGYDPLLIVSTLRGYLNGSLTNPTTQQSQIISGAFSHEGLPPDLTQATATGAQSAVASVLGFDPHDLNILRNADTGGIYEVNPNGVTGLYHLTPGQLADLQGGNPGAQFNQTATSYDEPFSVPAPTSINGTPPPSSSPAVPIGK